MSVLITGSTDGIGLATAKQLVGQGVDVALHGRNPDKLDAALADVKGASKGSTVTAFAADLSDLEQVASLAETVLDSGSAPRVLINNAGVFKTPSPIAANGLDVRFVVNTLAPVLLTHRLLPAMSVDARIVNLSSAAQAPVSLAALSGEQSLSEFDAYAQSKLALTMWSQGMGESLTASGQMMVAVNPGSLLASKMVTEGFGVAGSDIGIGVDILCRAGFSEEFANAGGRYYDNDAKTFAPPHADASDPEKTQSVVDAIYALLGELGHPV